MLLLLLAGAAVVQHAAGNVDTGRGFLPEYGLRQETSVALLDDPDPRQDTSREWLPTDDWRLR